MMYKIYNIVKKPKLAYSGRGGERDGSGRPSQWINKKTTAVRVPEIHLESILKYAHELDGESISDSVQNQTDLSEQMSELVQRWQSLAAIAPKTSRDWTKCRLLLQELQHIAAKNT